MGTLLLLAGGALEVLGRGVAWAGLLVEKRAGRGEANWEETVS